MATSYYNKYKTPATSWKGLGLGTIFTILLTGLAQYLSTWWMAALVPFIIFIFVKTTPAKAYLAGFLALSMLWGALCWWFNTQNMGVLATQMGELLGKLSAPQLIAATTFLGGLIGGLGAMTGSMLRRLFER